MKEVNELKEIWKREFLEIYIKKNGKILYYHNCDIKTKRLFWTLKAKIDDYKKQIITMAETILKIEERHHRVQKENDKYVKIINRIEKEVSE